MRLKKGIEYKDINHLAKEADTLFQKCLSKDIAIKIPASITNVSTETISISASPTQGEVESVVERVNDVGTLLNNVLSLLTDLNNKIKGK